MNPYNALKQYHRTDVQGGVMGASPHKLIQLLINGALDRINKAKAAMKYGNVAKKGEYIGGVIDIINGLKDSLDKENGGTLAENLENLYSYMGRQLLSANLNNDETKLEEVANLLSELKSAWVAIGPEAPVSAGNAAIGGSTHISVGA
ncbi:MAG: flagellar export chaperone FliS [Gammaproteobacteria bacterium]|nr:flagellar export chaperone FliS [Gammaproteobacteria bacterium]